MGGRRQTSRVILWMAGLIVAAPFMGAATPASRYNDIVTRLRGGDGKAACADAVKLVTELPGFFGGHNLLGLCVTESGQLEAANMHFLTSLQLNPGFLDSRVNLASNLTRLGRAEEAAREFREVLRRAPNHLSALTNLGALELARGEPCRASGPLEKAAGLAPTDGAISLSLAEALLRCGQADGAWPVLQRAEPALSGTARWNVLAGETAFRLNQPKQALGYLRKTLELEPKVESHWMKMGELLLAYESDQAAAAYFTAGLKELPNSAALHVGLAVADLAGGRRTEESLALLEKALTLEPGFEPALLALCRAYEQLRDEARLGETAARWRRLNAKRWEPYYFLALARGGRGDAADQEALNLLKEAIRLNPQAADAQIALGKLLLDRNQPAEAVKAFAEASRLRPGDAQPHYYLAQTYRKLGDERRSVEELEKFKLRKSAQPSWKVFFQVAK